jgi:dTDP-4-dehydrorhamnose 3,5-epimerase
MIDGVRLTPLRIIGDERGSVMHMLRATDAHFAGFGEVYFSTIVAGARKEWRLHRKHTSQLAVVVGTVRFVLHPGNAGGAGGTEEIEIGASNYQLLTIPPGVWYAFENRGSSTAIIANCSNGVHDPNEAERRGFDDPPAPYVWRN